VAGRASFAHNFVAGACPGPHIRTQYAPARTRPGFALCIKTRLGQKILAGRAPFACHPAYCCGGWVPGRLFCHRARPASSCLPPSQGNMEAGATQQSNMELGAPPMAHVCCGPDATLCYKLQVGLPVPPACRRRAPGIVPEQSPCARRNHKSRGW